MQDPAVRVSNFETFAQCVQTYNKLQPSQMSLTNSGDLRYHCPFCGTQQPDPVEGGGCVHFAYVVGEGELLDAGPPLLKFAPEIYDERVSHTALLTHFSESQNFVEFLITTASDTAFLAFTLDVDEDVDVIRASSWEKALKSAWQLVAKGATRGHRPKKSSFIVHETKPANYNFYASTMDEPCWYISAPWADGRDGLILRSSRLIVVGKLTGKILYDGAAGDEG